MDNNQQKSAILEFISDKFDEQNTFAVTLTMKQALYLYSPMRTRVSLTQHDAEQNLRHFLNVLNYKFFKKQAAKGKKLKAFPVIEGDDRVRTHFHLIIEKPEHISDEQFQDLITSNWQRTTWGYQVVEIKRRYSEGWEDYMLKPETKEEYDLSIGWTNSSF